MGAELSVSVTVPPAAVLDRLAVDAQVSKADLVRLAVAARKGRNKPMTRKAFDKLASSVGLDKALRTQLFIYFSEPLSESKPELMVDPRVLALYVAMVDDTRRHVKLERMFAIFHSQDHACLTAVELEATVLVAMRHLKRLNALLPGAFVRRLPSQFYDRAVKLTKGQRAAARVATERVLARAPPGPVSHLLVLDRCDKREIRAALNYLVALSMAYEPLRAGGDAGSSSVVTEYDTSDLFDV
eukprot:c9625_g1_i1.p1 GENE.c9625_g1_i1~~c9625_g1_i1.p1  ORF type:complete len:242 (-),score=40.99 c9625_g1_i1:738-1463(-)